MSGFLLVSPGSYLLTTGTDRLLLGDAPAPVEPTQTGAGLLPNIRRMIAERERAWAIEQERLRRDKNTALVVVHMRARTFVSAVVEGVAEVAVAAMSCRSFCRSVYVESHAQASIGARLSTFAGGNVSARRDDDELAFLLRLL